MDKIKLNKNMVLRAVLLDIGDTLLPALTIAGQALDVAARQLCSMGFLHDVDRFLVTYREVDSRFHGPAVNHLFSGLDICTKVAEVLSVRRPLLFAGALLAAYRDAVRRSIQYTPTLVAQLGEIRNQGCAIGVVTDGTTVEQTETLLRLGIIDLIDAFVVSEDIGKEKPSEEMFRRALVELGINRPAEALMVGDSLEKDIAGAKALGMRTAWLRAYTSPEENRVCHPDVDYAISALEDLNSVLRSLGVPVREVPQSDHQSRIARLLTEEAG